MAKASWQSLIVTVALVVSIKFLTGIAFLLLLLVALGIFAMSLGLSLRLQRVRRQV